MISPEKCLAKSMANLLLPTAVAPMMKMVLSLIINMKQQLKDYFLGLEDKIVDFENVFTAKEVINNSTQKVVQNSESFNFSKKNFKPKKRLPAKSPQKEPPPPEDKKIPDKKAREETKLLEQKKAQESAEIAKKFKEEKSNRKKRQRQLQQQELYKQLQQEEEDRKLKQVQLEVELKKQKEDRLASILSKAEERKKHMEQVKEHAKNQPKKLSRLYKLKEQEFNSNFVIPELEKRKAELAKRRLDYSPMSFSEISEHGKKYSEVQKAEHERRKKAFRERKVESDIDEALRHRASQYIKQERQARELEAQELQEKRRLAQKRKRYGSLVREIYEPSVDPLKQKEMELIKDRLKNPVPKRSSYSNGTSTQSRQSFRIRNRSPPPPRPKKSPQLKESASVESARLKKIDYLESRRERRKQEEEKVWEDFPDVSKSQGNSISDVRKKAKILDKESKRREGLLKHMNLNKLSEFKKIEAEAHINQMLIESVKAKFSLLH